MADFKSLEKKIDDLTGAVAKGFVRVEKRLEKLEKHTKVVDQKFAVIDERFNVVDQKLDRIERRLDDRAEMVQNHESRLGKVERVVFPQPAK
ncbi:MAG: hypothetical protein V4474_01310 [Patescibacteria group bacterium]